MGGGVEDLSPAGLSHRRRQQPKGMGRNSIRPAHQGLIDLHPGLFAPSDWPQFPRHAQGWAFVEALALLQPAVKRLIMYLLAAPPMPSSSPRSPIPRACLLLVDDSPVNIRILVELLKSDFDLEVATDGATALEICASPQHIDLILLDLMMPGIDGFEVCRRLKAMESRRHVPVIFLTASTGIKDIVYGVMPLEPQE